MESSPVHHTQFGTDVIWRNWTAACIGGGCLQSPATDPPVMASCYVKPYEDSHRCWRKNRRPPPSGSNCSGVDLNRNYPGHFGGEGTSAEPCENNYK
jgi:hypothetical protein